MHLTGKSSARLPEIYFDLDKVLNTQAELQRLQYCIQPQPLLEPYWGTRIGNSFKMICHGCTALVCLSLCMISDGVNIRPRYASDTSCNGRTPAVEFEVLRKVMAPESSLRIRTSALILRPRTLWRTTTTGRKQWAC